MKTNANERIVVLRSVALFADVSERELAFLGEHSSVKHFAANELIFSEGDLCQGLFIVQSGSMKIFEMADLLPCRGGCGPQTRPRIR